MKKVHKVHALGEVQRFAEAMSKIKSPGDYVVVARGVPRAVIMSCPDGCGEVLTVNLDRRAGPAWRKYMHGNRLTIYPSVWRESGCGAHFIVWHDKILWCGSADDEVVNVDLDDQLVALICARLPVDHPIHYETLADSIESDPWEVHWACRKLVRSGYAVQEAKGYFRKLQKPSPPKSGRIDVLA
jgi:hypothetical protein